MKRYYAFCVAGLLIAGCTSENLHDTSPPIQPVAVTTTDVPEAMPISDAFKDYWYQGKAEITSYKLEQARYGEMREGHAVLVFVTEDFSRSKHVKLDDPSGAGTDAVKVMKLNAVRKFNTGIYPYSMMSSIFTPINAEESRPTLKVTTSSQEWCGHTFTQLNKIAEGASAKAGYQVELRSYFESESDQDFQLEGKLLEDHLWNQIRLNPNTLPTGDIRLIPGTMYQRLRHTKMQIEPAQATLATEDKISTYTLTYETLDRTLAIRFYTAFPHEIEGWEETSMSGWGDGAKRLTTRATRNESLMLDYWTKNHNTDEVYRAQLGLD